MLQQPKIENQNVVIRHKPDKVLNQSRNKLYKIIGAVVVLSLLVLGILFYKSQTKLQTLEQELKRNTQEQTEVQPMSVLEEIGKLIVLPKDEEPTIATVSDIAKLPQQAFFKNAKEGNKVIVYNKAKKAILYRPEENKIIEIAPLLNDAATPSTIPNQ